MRGTVEDPKKTAALARQVGVDFGAAMTVALAYIGDRLGVFRAMSEGAPMTSVEIAERTRLDERYVREWASTMGPAYSASAGRGCGPAGRPLLARMSLRSKRSFDRGSGGTPVSNS
jgi:hypothetical protein